MYNVLSCSESTSRAPLDHFQQVFFCLLVLLLELYWVLVLLQCVRTVILKLTFHFLKVEESRWRANTVFFKSYVFNVAPQCTWFPSPCDTSGFHCKTVRWQSDPRGWIHGAQTHECRKNDEPAPGLAPRCLQAWKACTVDPALITSTWNSGQFETKVDVCTRCCWTNIQYGVLEKMWCIINPVK